MLRVLKLFMWPFSKDKSVLGIDIGTLSVKLVQLKKDGNIFKLENYAELIVNDYLEQPDKAIQSSTLKMQDSQVAGLLKTLINTSKITAKKAVFSIPLFSSFVTLVEMPKMTMDEIANAISFEARQYVPVPINEVVLDWSVVGSVSNEAEKMKLLDIDKKEGGEKLQVLLVAVPKEVVEKYHRIARFANLELIGLEVESFALAKSLVQKDPRPICILDIGARSSNISIVENGYVKLTHNIDTSGSDLTKALANSLNVSIARAESLKREQGLKLGEIERDVYNVLVSMLDVILNEVEKYIALYSKKTNKNIEKIILSGGSSNLSGLDKYIFDRLKIKVEFANPFKNIQYSPVLNPIIKEISPIFAISIGLVMSY